MFRKVSYLIVLALLVLAIALFAGEGKKEKAEYKTFSGKLVCQGCDLKMAEGARAACKSYGHKHALKTAKGNYVGFLENKFSADLISGEKYHNADVEVRGIYYANANLLDVETYTVDGNGKAWCEGHGAMDACMVSK